MLKTCLCSFVSVSMFLIGPPSGRLSNLDSSGRLMRVLVMRLSFIMLAISDSISFFEHLQTNTIFAMSVRAFIEIIPHSIRLWS